MHTNAERRPGGNGTAQVKTAVSSGKSEGNVVEAVHQGFPDELLNEFAAAARDATRADFDRLIANGVPGDWLWFGPMRFGIAEIATYTDGTYEPMAGGKRAIVIPAVPLDDDEDLVDLVAWHHDDPARWWCRLDTAPIMNPAAIDRAEIYREPLALHSCPMAWLRAGGEGAVVLDDDLNLRLWFGGVSDIVFDEGELAFAKRIERRLKQRTRLPALHVRTRESAKEAA